MLEFIIAVAAAAIDSERMDAAFRIAETLLTIRKSELTSAEREIVQHWFNHHKGYKPYIVRLCGKSRKRSPYYVGRFYALSPIHALCQSKGFLPKNALSYSHLQCQQF